MITYSPWENRWVSEYLVVEEPRCDCDNCLRAFDSRKGTNWEELFGEPELKTNAALDLLRYQIHYNLEQIKHHNEEVDRLMNLIEKERTRRAVFITKNNELEIAYAKLTKEQ